MLKNILKSYLRTTNWTKILLFICLLLFLVLLFNNNFKKSKGIEGFEQNDKFVFKTGNDVYDNFYATVYDYLVFNNLKDDYEVGEIIKQTHPTTSSKILDIGCSTGNQIANIGSKGYDVLGIDISPSMIKIAKENYPKYKFEVKDAMNQSIFQPNTFTHIICMYFTIYYFKDRQKVLQNIYNWLTPNGKFVVHLVDRKMFDPILPPGNPMLLVSPQRYAKKRITTTKVKFEGFSYDSDFNLDENNNLATFTEKFKSDDGNKIRKNEHVLYMPEKEDIINEIQSIGFISDGIVDLINCQYEYQYLYIFSKPA